MFNELLLGSKLRNFVSKHRYYEKQVEYFKVAHIMEITIFSFYYHYYYYTVGEMRPAIGESTAKHMRNKILQTIPSSYFVAKVCIIFYFIANLFQI